MIKFNIKKIIAVTLMSATILGSISTGASAAWKKDNSGWWYTEGNYYAMGWRNIDGNWYYFSPMDGYMYTQTTVDGCYLNDNGAWVNDSNFVIKASKAEELVRQTCYPGSRISSPFIDCSDFDGTKWTVRAYENNPYKITNIGWYYVDITTGKIIDMINGKPVDSTGVTTVTPNTTTKVSSQNEIDKAKNLIYQNDGINIKKEKIIVEYSSIASKNDMYKKRNIYQAANIDEEAYVFRAKYSDDIDVEPATYYVGKESGRVFFEYNNGGGPLNEMKNNTVIHAYKWIFKY